jgi:tRNA (cmo5U34)-methyltransferase
MKTPLSHKSSVDQIRQRFDKDVDRFSVLETGQTATIDATLSMTLIAQAACACTNPIQRVLDIGCGAGNNSLRLLEIAGHDFEVDLLDLSMPMLARATARVRQINSGKVRTIHADFRNAAIPDLTYDVILAAAVLHHLRDDDDWLQAFQKMYRLLTLGGSVWITDLVFHEDQAVQELMWARYGEYLGSLGGSEYRDRVIAYIDQEDSPRPITFQLELLRKVGFDRIDLLHKNSCFAAFGAVKSG